MNVGRGIYNFDFAFSVYARPRAGVMKFIGIWGKDLTTGTVATATFVSLEGRWASHANSPICYRYDVCSA